MPSLPSDVVSLRISRLPAGARALAGELAELLRAGADAGAGAAEARTEAPGPGGDHWVIYWKLRSGAETRLLAAHPEQGLWVATCALAAAYAEKLARRLSALAPGETLSLHDDPELIAGTPVARTSNFRLEIACE